VLEWWLEPPVVLRKLLHAHVDGLVEHDGGRVAGTSSISCPSAYEWSAHTDQGCRRDGRAAGQDRKGSSVPADLELGRAHGHGALHLDDDERGREGGRDAQPLRENTQRHASARQRHHLSQLTRPGGSCLPAASAPSPYVVPIAAISHNLATAPPPAPDESGQSTETRIHSCTKLKLEQF